MNHSAETPTFRRVDHVRPAAAVAIAAVDCEAALLLASRRPDKTAGRILQADGGSPEAFLR